MNSADKNEHLDPERVKKFATSLLTEEENKMIGKHLLFCESCRNLVPMSNGINVLNATIKTIEHMESLGERLKEFNLEVVDIYSLFDINMEFYTAEMMHELYPKLKEDAAYLVAVCYSSGNPVHEAILLTGFKSGGNWQLCNVGYDAPQRPTDVYVLQVIKELHTFSEHTRNGKDTVSMFE